MCSLRDINQIKIRTGGCQADDCLFFVIICAEKAIKTLLYLLFVIVQSADAVIKYIWYL